MQEEFRRNTRDGSSSQTYDEENFTLAAKEMKGKGKKSYSKSESRKEGKKRDMSKVKCFHYHEHGNYATNCPQKKKNTKASGSTASEDLAFKIYNLTSHSLHAWCQVQWDRCGAWIMVHIST